MTSRQSDNPLQSDEANGRSGPKPAYRNPYSATQSTPDPSPNNNNNANEAFNALSLEWKDEYKSVSDRYETYALLFDKRTERDIFPFQRKIILIDLMIDKAQKELEHRAHKYFYPGIALLVFSVLTLAAFALYMLSFNDSCAQFDLKNATSYQALATIISILKDSPAVCSNHVTSNWYDFTLILLRRTISGGAILAIAYLFAANANACFRESTRLLHRRHNLRYIRLLLYKSGGELDNKELRDTFGIDDVTTSGFDNIKSEFVLNNLIGKLIDKLPDITSIAADKKGIKIERKESK